MGRAAGLAAPQVGHNIRMFWALDNLYINPEIINRGGTLILCKEGCYSLEDNKFDYEVERYSHIEMKWQDKKGVWHQTGFGGIRAQVIQHEYDHIEGKTCVDIAPKKEELKVEKPIKIKKVKKMENQSQNQPVEVDQDPKQLNKFKQN